jgi:hypothetical protein
LWQNLFPRLQNLAVAQIRTLTSVKGGNGGEVSGLLAAD